MKLTADDAMQQDYYRVVGGWMDAEQANITPSRACLAAGPHGQSIPA
jgi:hypothetical protein